MQRYQPWLVVSELNRIEAAARAEEVGVRNRSSCVGAVAVSTCEGEGAVIPAPPTMDAAVTMAPKLKMSFPAPAEMTALVTPLPVRLMVSSPEPPMRVEVLMLADALIRELAVPATSNLEVLTCPPTMMESNSSPVT